MVKYKKALFATLIAVFILIFTVYPLYLYYKQFSHSGLSNDPTAWAGFGAYIGGILGPVLAFATFWMLFFTFFLQKKQFKNVETQKFENTFYSLLELHNQALANLEPKLTVEVLSALFDAPSLIKNPLNMPDEKIREYDNSTCFERKELKYKGSDKYLYDLQNSILKEVELSQYFRILYQLLKFIAKNNINNPSNNFDENYLSIINTETFKHEKMYSSIVRGFVPVKLLPILSLNCIPTEGGLTNLDKYRDLLERYSFLEHMRFDILPADLPTFFVLNNYNRALGDNEHIEDKATAVLNNFNHFKVKDGSFLNDFIEFKRQQQTLPSLTYRQRCDAHLEKIGKGFYSESSTIHEPIIFLVSNIATSVFYLTLFTFLFNKYQIIFNKYPFCIEFLLALMLCILFILSIYTFSVTAGRLAVTLGTKNISDKKAIFLISSVLVSVFVIQIIGVLMAV